MQSFSRVTGAMETRQPDFEAINPVEEELTTKIERGRWLTGRWYDTDSRALLGKFNDRQNQLIKYVNTRNDFHGLIDILEAGWKQIERIERDKQAALASVATLYPIEELRQHATTLSQHVAAADSAAVEAEACLEGFDNHKVVELLRQCKLPEAEAAIEEMDKNNPVYGQARAHVAREQSARRQLASAQKLWMDRDIGGDYRKYQAAYDILKGAQDPPAPCPDTQAALVSALAEIERLLAGADAASEPARAEKARTHIAECKLATARQVLGPDFPINHPVWAEIASREQGEGQARALYAKTKAILSAGGDDGGRLARLEQAKATLATASGLDLCGKTRKALARVIAKLDARIVQVRIAGARAHLAACRLDDARAMIAPIGDGNAEKQAILSAIEDEGAVRVAYTDARQRLSAEGTAENPETLAAIRQQMAGLRERAACDQTRDAIDQAMAAIDGAIEKAGSKTAEIDADDTKDGDGEADGKSETAKAGEDDGGKIRW